jgi:hypothetical protein
MNTSDSVERQNNLYGREGSSRKKFGGTADDKVGKLSKSKIVSNVNKNFVTFKVNNKYMSIIL